MNRKLLASQFLHFSAKIRIRAFLFANDMFERIPALFEVLIPIIMIPLCSMSGCSPSALPYPTSSSSQRTLNTLDDGSWLEGTLHVKLGDLKWEDKGNYYVLKSTVYFSNRSGKNIYYLEEDLSEPSFLLENLDGRTRTIFSGTMPPAQSEFWSNSLRCSVPGDEFKADVEWDCWPSSDELGLRFQIDDYVVYAGNRARISYLLKSAVSSALIQTSDDPTYVDMWALAGDSRNSFQTDSRSEWVIVTFPEKNPGETKNNGKDRAGP